MRLLATILFLSFLSTPAPVAAAPTQAPEWELRILPGGELFPALDLSQQRSPRRGEGSGLVSVQVRGPAASGALRVTLDTPGLRGPAQVEIGVGDAARAQDLRPRLEWDLATLRGLEAPRRQTLTATLEAPGFTTSTRQVEVRLHPLSEVLYYVREGDEHVDLGWTFAAYVDPQATTVDEILTQARRIRPDFDRAPLPSRVEAVWGALEQHGLRYAEGDPAISRGPLLWSQRVRMPEDVWRDRRANCVDGSVLIAAVLERLDARPFIALLPGHALVGFRNGSESTVLETTVLGEARSQGESFTAARRAGRERWRRAASRLDGRHGPDYAVIDIATARRYGIRPFAQSAVAEPTAIGTSNAAPAPR